MPDRLTSSDFWDQKWLAGRPAKASKLRARYRSWLSKRGSFLFDEVLLRILNKAKSDKPALLEIGCAPGSMLQRIHRLAPRIELNGLDYAEDGLKIAQSLLSKNNIPANIRLGDVFNATFSTQFDLVVSFGLIEHFADPVPVLKRHVSFTKPGGWVGVTVPNFATPFIQNRLIKRLWPETFDTHNLGIMKLDALHRALGDAGLHDVEVGYGGGPLLHSGPSPRTVLNKSFWLAGRAWNSAVGMAKLNRLWHSVLWGTGKA
jgi:2-polyprenyl-3-methyl-5-hydroxy-6-metoxy-1,4-benzoquinol methylase